MFYIQARLPVEFIVKSSLKASGFELFRFKVVI